MDVIKINTSMSKDEMIAEYARFIKEFGKGFHPDEDAQNYVNINTDEPTFTPAEAHDCNVSIDILHSVLGEEIYTIGLQVFESM